MMPSSRCMGVDNRVLVVVNGQTTPLPRLPLLFVHCGRLYRLSATTRKGLILTRAKGDAP
jgi:hypothetical protein